MDCGMRREGWREGRKTRKRRTYKYGTKRRMKGIGMVGFLGEGGRDGRHVEEWTKECV